MITVHELRRRWKPHKDRLVAERPAHPTPIRFHRAFSWLARVERLEEADVDLALISQWVALNALYGQWNSLAGMAVGDRESWRVFLDRVVDLDTDQLIARVLLDHQRLARSILEDAYLSDLFWQEPEAGAQSTVQATVRATARRMRSNAQMWYFEKRYKLILDQVVERIYLMRCQLIHGAATYGGKLNRRSLRHCATMLKHLIPALFLVLIERGADEDWGIMCYPPLEPER
ncbi:MAG: HEPN domain-containing protein [Pirellulales bacterium]